MSKASTQSSLTILIPVYNEEKTLKKVLKATTDLAIDYYEVIIVDDASKDRSPKIINDFVRSFKKKNIRLKTYKHAVNMGKGSGIQTGLKHATGKYFVIQDADLEYDPKFIPGLLEQAVTGRYDAVYGSRFLGKIKNMPKANYMANHAYNFILRILYNTRITDMHTCYKMVRTDLLKEIRITSSGFDYATELISKLLKRGIVIHEFPISFNGRTKKEGKKINVMDGAECAYKLLRFRFTTSENLFSEKTTTFERFILVGGLGFLCNYAVLVSLYYVTSLGHVVAEAIAAAIALQLTFLLHDTWTYKLHAPEGTRSLALRTRYLAYISSNAFGSLITVISFSFLFHYMNRLPALLIAAISGVVWNYIINTYVIWKRRV